MKSKHTVAFKVFFSVLSKWRVSETEWEEKRFEPILFCEDSNDALFILLILLWL